MSLNFNGSHLCCAKTRCTVLFVVIAYGNNLELHACLFTRRAHRNGSNDERRGDRDSNGAQTDRTEQTQMERPMGEGGERERLKREI